MTCLRPLPVEVIPYQTETVESFWRRLCHANAISPEDLWLALRHYDPHLPLAVAPHHAVAHVEAVGGLSSHHFADSRRRARARKRSTAPFHIGCALLRATSQPVTLCRRCTRGEKVAVDDAVGPICVRHRRWHDADLDLDMSGMPSHLSAQRILNGELRQRGIAYRTGETDVAHDLIQLWRESCGELSRRAEAREVADFPLAVTLALRLTESTIVNSLSQRTAGVLAHAVLIERVVRAVLGGGGSREMVAQIAIRGREALINDTVVRSFADRGAPAPFARQLVSRVPTLRARLLSHRDVRVAV